jgi:hypothetical protein
LVDRPDGLAALGLWVAALAWIGEELTDGFVPDRQPTRLTGFDATHLVADLVAVGLWEREVDGWRVHDYAHYNLTREQVLERRALRAAAGAVGAATRWGRDGKSHPKWHGKEDGSEPDEMDRGTDAPIPGGTSSNGYLPLIQSDDVAEPTFTSAPSRDGWATFESPTWIPFRTAWTARGLRLPPTGKQRELLFEVADARPKDLGRWTSEAPGKGSHQVVRYILDRWHETKAAAT